MSASLKLIAKIFSTKEFIEVSEEYFIEPHLKKIYKAVQKYYINFDKIPTVSYFVKSIIPKIEKDDTVKEQLKSVLSNLPDDVDESVAELQSLSEESYKKISLSRLGKEFADALKKDSFEDISLIISKMSAVQESGGFDHLEDDNENMGLQSVVKRVSTGFESEDRNLSTVPESSIILITGAPKNGKTTVALMGIINKFFKDKSNVLLYSWEMTKSQLILRTLSMLSGVPYEEVEGGKFTIKENRLRVQAINLAFKYDIDPEDAIKLIFDKGESAFEKLNKRKNKIFIRAGLSTDDMKLAKAQGKRIKDMPTAETLVGEIKEYHKAYGIGAYLVDYVQQVPSKSPDREKGITELIKALKDVCITTSATGYIPAQSESSDSRIPKYARSLSMYCDIQVAIVRTKELDKFNSIGLGIAINRHGPWGYATLWDNQLHTMRLVENSTDQVSLDELFENKGKG